jgi:Transposase DDE domain group 1
MSSFMPNRWYLVKISTTACPAHKEIAGVGFAQRRTYTFAANADRLQLHALAYNLGNFLRTLATPEPTKDWSLTSLKEKLIKIGAKVVSHGRYIAFQMAEVAISRNLFADILRLIADFDRRLIQRLPDRMRVKRPARNCLRT